MGEKPLVPSRYLRSCSQSSDLGLSIQYQAMPLESRGRAPTRVIQVPCAGIHYNINVLHLEVQYRGRSFFHHGYSRRQRQQPDYVSTVDKSGFRVTNSRSKILSQDHENDHLRAQAEVLLPNASSICCTEPHTTLGTYLSCRHEGRRHQVATWGYKNHSDCLST